MRKLTGGVPRLGIDHRRADAYQYRAYALAIIARFWPDGQVPASARPLLKEAGRAVLELDRLAADFERARNANRRRDANRLRRQQQGQRLALLRLEDAMQAQAGSAGSFVDAHARARLVAS